MKRKIEQNNSDDDRVTRVHKIKPNKNSTRITWSARLAVMAVVVKTDGSKLNFYKAKKKEITNISTKM